ncbi:MAG TPA: hypothetical protein VFX07_12780 [Candidatus Udaeobacter sp.]|nr:hypothetical protein [Candidatus Udaeobacter sp.]
MNRVNPFAPAMTPGITGCQPVVRGSLPRTGFGTRFDFGEMHSVGGRMLQAGSLCSPDSKTCDHRQHIYHD